VHEQVDSLIRLRRYTEAESLARQALSDRPDDAFMHVLLSRSLMHQDKTDQAITEVNRAISLNPDFAYSYRIQGMLLREKGDQAGANDAFTTGINADPYDALMFLQRAHLDIAGVNRSTALTKLKRSRFEPSLDRARQDLDTAVELAPQHADVHLGFCALFSVQGRNGDAEQAARTALQFDPQSPTAHEMLGILAERRNDVRAASDHYVAAGRSDPTADGPLDRLKRLGTPALAVPGFLLYVLLRVGTRGARLGGAIAVGIVVLLVLAVASWLAYRYLQRREAREKLSPEAKQILANERDHRKRFGR
jgi:tetratricopeptide (TPR) repeat protein